MARPFADKADVPHQHALEALHGIGILFPCRLHVGQQPPFDQVEHGGQHLVFALEVAVDARGDQTHASGDGRHAQPPQPLVGHEAQGRFGNLFASDLGIEFCLSHDRPLL